MSRRGGGYSHEIELDDGLDAYKSASEKAWDRFDNAGLELMDDRPRYKDGRYFDGRLPANISDFSLADLEEIMSLMTQYTEYVEELLFVARAEVTNSAEALKLVKAKVRKTYTGTKDEKDDATLIDTRFVEANANWLSAKEYKELLEGAKNSSSRNNRTLSRIFELRKQAFEQNRRTTTAGGGGRERFEKPRGRRGRGRG